MKKIVENIIITVVLSIIIYFLCTRFFFKVPSPTGIGYEEITYQIGRMVAAIVAVISFILLCIFNRKK